MDKVEGIEERVGISVSPKKIPPKRKKSFWTRLYEQRQLAVLTLPFVAVILVFNYMPIWGWLYAFQDFKPRLGLWNSTWVGLENFKNLFGDEFFYRALRNTLGISSLKLVLNFASTITLAVLLNEVRHTYLKRVVQTVSYLPHFVSWVVAANLVFVALSTDGGIVNEILLKIGLVSEPISFMGEGNYFWAVAALSEVWKEVGFGAIIYLSAMAGIDLELYEAASMDGAGRIRRIFTITLPSIAPTIKILLILSVGWILSAGFDQVYLMQKPSNWDYSEILELYIFKYGIQQNKWSFASAAGIFNSVVGLTLVLTANKISKKLDGERVF